MTYMNIYIPIPGQIINLILILYLISCLINLHSNSWLDYKLDTYKDDWKYSKHLHSNSWLDYKQITMKMNLQQKKNLHSNSWLDYKL